jgi:hypothetical protein
MAQLRLLTSDHNAILPRATTKNPQVRDTLFGRVPTMSLPPIGLVRNRFDPPGSFGHMYGVLEQWVTEHGHARVPKPVQVGDVKLGPWVQALRERYRQGKLGKDRVERLEALAGWSWDTRNTP